MRLRFFSALALGVCVLFAGQTGDATPGLVQSDEPIRMSASEFPRDELLLAMESPTRIFIRSLDSGETGDEDEGGETEGVAPVDATDGNLHVGMNLSYFNYYSPQWFNVDLTCWVELRSDNYFSSWRGSGNRLLDLRDDGYPARLVELSGNVEGVSGGSSSLTITSRDHGLQVGDVVRVEGLRDGGGNHHSRVIETTTDTFSLEEGLSSHTGGGVWHYRQKANGLMAREIAGRYPGGDYTLRFEGEGAIELRWDAPDKRYEHDGNGLAEFIVPVSPSSNGVEFNIVSTNPDNPVRNVRLLMPGFDDGDYHPLFVERLEPFRGAIRFMNTNNTNFSNVQKWENRTPADWPWYGRGGKATYRTGTATRLEEASNGGPWDDWGQVVRVTSRNHGLTSGHLIQMRIPGIVSARESAVRVIDANTFEVRASSSADIPSSLDGNWDWTLEIRAGYPYERMIELANQTRSHMWVTVPAMADDDYMRNLAQLIRDQLDEDLCVYVELSNEVWNTVFSQYQVVHGWAERDGVSFHHAYANRCRDLFRIFSEEFAGQEDRLVRTVGGQRVSAWRSEQILQHMNGEFDALAITTYFGVKTASLPSDVTAEDIAQMALDNVSSDDWLEPMQAQADLIAQYSSELGRDIRLVAYEGGQHITPNGQTHSYQQELYDAQRHPLMGEAYKVMLDRFKSVGGDLFVGYSFVQIDTPYGSWGHLSYQDSDPARHPKYNVLIDHINQVLGTDY